MEKARKLQTETKGQSGRPASIASGRHTLGQQSLLASWHNHPAIWVSALLTPLFIFGAIAADGVLGEFLQNFPVLANILATFLSIPLVFLVGAVVFDRVQADADKRRQQRLEQEMKATEIVGSLLPRMAALRARLQENPLLRSGDESIKELSSQFSTLEHKIRENPGNEISLTDVRIPAKELRDLHAFMLALPLIRDTIDSFDEPLLTVGSLTEGLDLWQSIQHVITEVARFRYALPSPRLERSAPLLEHMLNRPIGTWDGNWVTRGDGGGYSLNLEEMRQLASAAGNTAAAAIDLDSSLDTLAVAVRQNLHGAS